MSAGSYTMTRDQYFSDYSSHNSFLELFEAQSKRYHDKEFIQYQSSNPLEPKLCTLTYGQYDRISTYLAHEWESELNGVHCVGILSDDCLQTLLAMTAVLKLGRIFFPISTGNSETAITQLLKGANTQYLLASEPYSNTARICASHASIAQVKIWKSLDVEHLASLTSNHDRRTFSDSRPRSSLSDDILVIQSSGSTGLPKPLLLSNQWLIRGAQLLAQKSKNSEPFIGPDDTLLSTSAVYHTFGHLSYWTPLFMGSKMFMFRNRPPPPDGLLSTALQCGATIMTGSPIHYENLAKYIQAEGNNEMTTAVLKQFNICLYAGAPLGMLAGTLLHSKGLNVRCAYGSTEAGMISYSSFLRDNQNWYTLKLIDAISSYCRLEPFGDGLYHLMIRGDYPPLCSNVKNDVGSGGYFATNDLFEEDPPMSGYWRYVRRINDTLVLNDGGKTDPISLESEIRNSSLVKRCLVVGHSKSHTGVLIELNLEEVANYKPNEIKSKVHEAVNRANTTAAQAHSVIAVPEMVYILPPDRKLPITSKDTVARREAHDIFEKEINKMYAAFAPH